MKNREQFLYFIINKSNRIVNYFCLFSSSGQHKSIFLFFYIQFDILRNYKHTNVPEESLQTELALDTAWEGSLETSTPEHPAIIPPCSQEVRNKLQFTTEGSDNFQDTLLSDKNI